MKHAIPSLLDTGGGAIVNVSSVNAARPGPMQGIYSITKAAVLNMTQAFAKECAGCHPKQYDAIADTLLPKLIEQRSGSRRHVRIWSAACSTGDEPYTLALLINEKVQRRFPNTRFEILGTDINTDVLNTAREGIYGSYAVRNTPDEYLRKYFTPRDDQYLLSSTLRNMVRFKHLNLTDHRALQQLRNFDIILCANVLIYFDDDTKQRVISNLYNSLRHGGYLFVGTSETLHGVTRAFQPVRFSDTIAYKKEDPHDRTHQ